MLVKTNNFTQKFSAQKFFAFFSHRCLFCAQVKEEMKGFLLVAAAILHDA